MRTARLSCAGSFEYHLQSMGTPHPNSAPHPTPEPETRNDQEHTCLQLRQPRAFLGDAADQRGAWRTPPPLEGADPGMSGGSPWRLKSGHDEQALRRKPCEPEPRRTIAAATKPAPAAMESDSAGGNQLARTLIHPTPGADPNRASSGRSSVREYDRQSAVELPGCAGPQLDRNSRLQAQRRSPEGTGETCQLRLVPRNDVHEQIGMAARLPPNGSAPSADAATATAEGSSPGKALDDSPTCPLRAKRYHCSRTGCACPPTRCLDLDWPHAIGTRWQETCWFRR